MSSARITFPQVLALMAIWTAVIYGVVVKPTASREALAAKQTTACAQNSKES